MFSFEYVSLPEVSDVLAGLACMGWETSSLLLSPFLVFWIAQGNTGLSFLLQRLICSYACMSRVALAGLPSLNL